LSGGSIRDKNQREKEEKEDKEIRMPYNRIGVGWEDRIVLRAGAVAND